MAQRVESIERIAHVQRRGEQSEACEHKRPGSRQKRATLRSIRPPNASQSVTPTEPCRNSVKISSGNSCMAFALFLCTLMRFDHQIRFCDGRIRQAFHVTDRTILRPQFINRPEFNRFEWTGCHTDGLLPFAWRSTQKSHFDICPVCSLSCGAP